MLGVWGVGCFRRRGRVEGGVSGLGNGGGGEWLGVKGGEGGDWVGEEWESMGDGGGGGGSITE